jgi:hypothetical protein
MSPDTERRLVLTSIFHCVKKITFCLPWNPENIDFGGITFLPFEVWVEKLCSWGGYGIQIEKGNPYLSLDLCRDLLEFRSDVGGNTGS